MSVTAPAPTAPLPRPGLAIVPGYRPGRRATGAGIAPLASNELQFGPLPSVAEAIRRAGLTANRYPDAAATELRSAIADHTGSRIDEIAVGTGSVAVLQQIVTAYCDPGDEVVYAWRSFEAYPVVVALAGATAVEVPLSPDDRHDLPAMAAAVTDRTRVIFVCSPNNPTGTTVTADELTAFLDRVPERVLVVVDEAYLEFAAAGPSASSALSLRRPNVCLLRTFSKAHGLAGLRVGYAIADAQVADALRRACVPFSVSAPAQAAAVASLAATDELAERVGAVVAERERLLPLVRELGWQAPPSRGNFLWIRTGRDHDRLAAAFDAAGILVRPFPGEGIRVTVGDRAANDRVLAVLEGARR